MFSWLSNFSLHSKKLKSLCVIFPFCSLLRRPAKTVHLKKSQIDNSNYLSFFLLLVNHLERHRFDIANSRRFGRCFEFEQKRSFTLFLFEALWKPFQYFLIESSIKTHKQFNNPKLFGNSPFSFQAFKMTTIVRTELGFHIKIEKKYNYFLTQNIFEKPEKLRTTTVDGLCWSLAVVERQLPDNSSAISSSRIHMWKTTEFDCNWTSLDAFLS